MCAYGRINYTVVQLKRVPLKYKIVSFHAMKTFGEMEV
jgi:hypothetical protein